MAPRKTSQGRTAGSNKAGDGAKVVADTVRTPEPAPSADAPPMTPPSEAIIDATPVGSEGAAPPSKPARKPRVAKVSRVVDAPKEAAAIRPAQKADGADHAEDADDAQGAEGDEESDADREPELGEETAGPDDAELEDAEQPARALATRPRGRARAAASGSDDDEVEETKEERSLRSRDPLAAYMADVQKHPLLTREEEVELAKKYRDHQDLRAAAKLVASNLRLVVKLAHEYHRNPLSLLDLIQEGNIGLMQAVKKFDPERGVKLSSYAAWWIRAYILRYIMDNWKLVKLGTTEAQRKLFFKLRQEQDRLQAQGFEVTTKLLADRLHVSEQDVVEMDQRLGHDELSLDAPLKPGDDDQSNRADRLLPSNAQAADDAIGDQQLRALFKDKLQGFAQTLNEKERYLFEKRLIADEPLTLQEVGTHFGVSRERARQIEAQLMNRMKTYMREEIPDFDLQTLDEE